MDVDPAASLRAWAIEVDLAGRVFEVPAMPAADWLPILAGGELIGILDLMEPADPAMGDVDDLIVSGQLSPEDLTAAMDSVVEQVTGRSPHVALTLAVVAKMQWTVIGGDLARRGFRWDQVSIGAALDAIYVTVIAHLKPEGIKKFESLLGTEPVVQPGTGRRRRRVNRQQALADFEQMAGPKPQPVKAISARSGGARPKTRPRPQPRPRAGR